MSNRPESPLAAQRRAVSEALAELTKAQVAYTAAKAKVADGIKQSPQWQQLSEAQSQAQKAFAAATQPVLDKLHATPQYQAVAQAKQKADEKLVELRSSPNPTADAFTEAGREQATNDAMMRKLEDDALGADGNAKQARTNLDAANQALNDLKKQADETAANDPSVQQAKQAVEEAQKKLEEAKKALIEAQRANRPQRSAPPPPPPRTRKGY